MTESAIAGADRLSVAAQFVTAPRLFSPDDAKRRLDGWLDDLTAEQRRTVVALTGAYPELKQTLESIAEASPYLFDLLRSNAEMVIRVLRSDPEARLAEMIAQAQAEVRKASDDATVMRVLRSLKNEAALLTALCDIGGVWPMMRVTQALTDVAAAAVQFGARYLLTQEAIRGRISPADPDNADADSGLIVLAMGKMGAGELNYSSDIDLIVFFDLDRNSLISGVEPQPFFVRIAQGMSRLLQQRTADGYVFRVDLRLRPDPASTPVALSTASALNYYEREGRTWERAAMIKAQPCAGDIKAGETLIAELSPFVWRKHLDFAALSDVHEMKRQMHAFKGHSEIAVEGHNVKQGRGGIREIEFFAQTQQLIAGGRHPILRARRTLDALEILADQNWITYQARDEMAAAYVFLRRVEHRIQMVADEQTHTLPEEHEAMERFARFLGYADRDAFAHDLLGHLNLVQGHYSKLFEGDTTTEPVMPAADFARGADDPLVLKEISALGFKQAVMVSETVKAWLAGDYRALKAESSLAAFTALVPSLLKNLARAENPDAAISQFDDFLQAVQRGARLIALLQQHPDLISQIAFLVGAAPRLGDMIARNPQLMDGLVDPRFFGAMPQQSEISERLQSLLADADGYEEFLDRLRMFGQESLFLIGSRILSGTVSAQLSGVAFADIAEAIVRTVHALVTDQFASQHGRIKDQQVAIVAMGRLGSREMTASSDLDLILLYDFDSDAPDSDGARRLHGSQYFARLTHRLISAFTTRTNQGVLYEVDMRLRPSGRSGPVATSLSSFAQYQESDAWTWEHMALTRARVVSASPEFRTKIEAVIASVLTRPRERNLIANDVLEMRSAIAQEKGDSDAWDLKYAAGGIVDIEFLAQYLQLVHASDHQEILDTGTAGVLDAAARLGLLKQADADILRPAFRLYQNINQILRLCVSGPFKPENAGADLLRLLVRASGEPDFSALQARLRETQAEVRQVFLGILGNAN